MLKALGAFSIGFLIGGGLSYLLMVYVVVPLAGWEVKK